MKNKNPKKTTKYVVEYENKEAINQDYFKSYAEARAWAKKTYPGAGYVIYREDRYLAFDARIGER